jgi:hypothetical protein
VVAVFHNKGIKSYTVLADIHRDLVVLSAVQLAPPVAPSSRSFRWMKHYGQRTTCRTYNAALGKSFALTTFLLLMGDDFFDLGGFKFYNLLITLFFRMCVSLNFYKRN